MAESEQFLAAIIVADVHGYSRLSEDQQKAFASYMAPDIRALLTRREARHPKVYDGDHVKAYFQDVLAAARCAVELRNIFRDPVWETYHLPTLRIRIALHAGLFECGEDMPDGAEHVFAARLEPVVEPGQIWASEAFRVLFEQRQTEYLRLVPLGNRPFSENFGTYPVYSLLSAHEDPPRVAVISPSAPDGSALGTCLQLASADNDAVRLRAIDVLGTFNSRVATEALGYALMSDPNPDARRTSALSLGQQASPEALPFLSQALPGEEVPAVRHAIVQALGEVGDPRAGPLLVELFYQSTKEPSPDASPADREPDKLLYDDNQLRCRLLLALSHIWTADVIKLVLEALKSDDARLVETACAAAEALGEEPRVTEQLFAIVSKKSNWTSHVRAAAMEALLGTGMRPGDIAAVVALVEDPTEPAEVRLPGLDLLAQDATSKARDTLIKIAMSPDDSLAPNAVQALSAVSSAKSIEWPAFHRREPGRRLQLVRQDLHLSKNADSQLAG